MNAQAHDGRLRASFAFSEGVHRRRTIEVLTGGFVSSFRSVFARATAPDAGGVAGSDFDERVGGATPAKLAAAAMEDNAEDFDA